MKDVFRDVHVNSFVLKGEGSCPTTISILFKPYITRAISGLMKNKKRNVLLDEIVPFHMKSRIIIRIQIIS